MVDPKRIEVTVAARELPSGLLVDLVAESLQEAVQEAVRAWRAASVGQLLTSDPEVSHEVLRFCDYVGRDKKDCILKFGHMGGHWPTDVCYICGNHNAEGHVCYD